VSSPYIPAKLEINGTWMGMMAYTAKTKEARAKGHLYVGVIASAPDSACLSSLLQRHQNASVIEQRCAGLSPRSADWNHKFTPDPWRDSSLLFPSLGIRHTRESQTRKIKQKESAEGCHYPFRTLATDSVRNSYPELRACHYDNDEADCAVNESGIWGCYPRFLTEIG
jgi:hypothetical protein